MARRKMDKEFIATEMTLVMMDSVVGTLNAVAESLRGSFDMESVGRELISLFRHTEHGFEPIPEQEREFAFTMFCRAIPSNRRMRCFEYRFRLNTYTNEITCIDKDNSQWAMPLLTDALSVIRDKAIEYAFSS